MLAALAALLLLAGVAGCGGGDSSDSTAAQGGGGSGESTASGGTAKQGGAKGDDEGQAGSSDSRPAPDPGSVGEFKPRHHSDSGGGAEQLKVKGGDNSVQEFGEEADTTEFEAAATALHNFLDARAEGNWAAVCQYLSKETIESLEKLTSKQGGDTSCGAGLAAIINPNAKAALKAEAEKADVRSLRTEGDQAFLIYTTDGTILAMPMADEAGTWKVAGLGGSALN